MGMETVKSARRKPEISLRDIVEPVISGETLHENLIELARLKQRKGRQPRQPSREYQLLAKSARPPAHTSSRTKIAPMTETISRPTIGLGDQGTISMAREAVPKRTVMTT